MKKEYNVLPVLGYSVICFMLFPLFLSCEEEVQLELNDNENQRIVVEGRLTNERKAQQVRITRTISYFDSELAPSVTDAQVYILEEGSGEQFSLSLVNDSLGIYATSASIPGKVGETYLLRIIDGEDTYLAEAYLDTVPFIDSLTFEYQYLSYFGFSFGIYMLKISAYEPPPEGQYYRIDIYINDTLYTDEMAESVYMSDFQINDMYLPEVEIYGIPQERIHLDSNTIRIEMFSISEEELKFIGDFLTESYGNGSIFSGPPANIQSNIENSTGGLDGLGFFGASAKSSIEATLYKAHNDSTNNPYMEVD